ncbi:hypothetical protein MKW98_004119 [Papaver atlanticum]|uniref:Glucose-6-phosphate dehydrogenase C-terminal domain-containing protein n=1 Tax=Papaver atlanticum TaxID=357466 RepID=A0AAD4XPV5_9MAGN|nr:hypothetical protein MKW98_004119 [Papaver atlanticum]
MMCIAEVSKGASSGLCKTVDFGTEGRGGNEKCKSHARVGINYPGYTDDVTVSKKKKSITQTFAAAALFIDNARWDGIKAGKALHARSRDQGTVQACSW